MKLLVALAIVSVVLAGIVLLYRSDMRGLSNTNPPSTEPVGGRIRRAWTWLSTRTDATPRFITMNCPVCRRPVEVTKSSGHGYYPEEFIAACRTQNGTSCGPFYDYIRGPLGLSGSPSPQRGDQEPDR